MLITYAVVTVKITPTKRDRMSQAYKQDFFVKKITGENVNVSV